MKILLVISFFLGNLAIAATAEKIKFLQISGLDICAATKSEVKCWHLNNDRKYSPDQAIKFTKTKYAEIKQLAVTNDAACVIADGAVNCGGTLASEGADIASELNKHISNPLRLATIVDSIGGNLVEDFCVMSSTNIYCYPSRGLLGPSSNGVPLLSSPLGPVNDVPYVDMVGVDGSLCVSAKSGTFCWGTRFSAFPSIAGVWPKLAFAFSPVSLFTAGDQVCALDKSGTADCLSWFDQVVLGDGKIRNSEGAEVTGISESYSATSDGLCLRRGSSPIQCGYSIGGTSNPRLQPGINAISSRWGLICFASDRKIKCQPVVYDGFKYDDIIF